MSSFFFNDTAPTEIYTLSLHDALPISADKWDYNNRLGPWRYQFWNLDHDAGRNFSPRSEEHTSELQSRFDLVCRLLLEKKKLVLRLQRTNGDLATRRYDALRIASLDPV